jgi:hypothetical protein
MPRNDNAKAMTNENKSQRMGNLPQLDALGWLLRGSIS